MRYTIARKRTIFILLLALVAAAGFVRIVNINKHMVWEDEIRHVYAAKAMLETGKPVLPLWGGPYNRAIAFTYLVSLFFKLFGVSEVIARLPSLIFGLLMIPTIYYVASRLINRGTGFISAVLAAFSPLFVTWSITCRMYSMLQLFYLFCAFYFFRMSAEAPDSGKRCWFDKNKNYFIFTFLYTFTFFIHLQSILFVPSAIFFLLITWLVSLNKTPNPAQNRGYFKLGLLSLITGSVLMGIVIFIMKNDFIKFVVSGSRYNPRFYLDLLWQEYNLMLLCYPIALFILICKKPKAGFYLASCFLIPLAAFSFIFKSKADRYMFFILPFFIITIASFFESALSRDLKLANRLIAGFFRNYGRVFNVKAFTHLVYVSIIVLLPLSFLVQKSLRASPCNSARITGTQVNFIKNLKTEDIVITDNYFLLAYYAQGTVDYLLQDKFKKRKRLNKTDPLGIYKLSQLEALENLVKTIWMIIRNSGRITRDEKIKNYVTANFKIHPFSNNALKIYYRPAAKDSAY
ncbi:MAG: glycosyltransferase family 39 protein [Candidatus Omnitrophica bacterium]|nr:glycosyltransferase family 39 protein [Candidatus Omnitrophota bacterium]